MRERSERNGKELILLKKTDSITKAPLEMFTAADVEPKEVSWLWYPYIPFGKVTMLQGESGEGKSMFALNLAALLTRGDPLPFAADHHEPMKVIYLNSEDDADDTIVPRFIKANGVRENLFFISEHEKRLSFSDERINESIRMTGARAMIIDPLASYFGPDVSMNLANEVRPRFESLIKAGRSNDCAIIVVSHLNKAEGMNAKNRSNGSVDIIAAPRSMLVIGKPHDDENPDHRIMAHGKCNIAPLGSSILFSVGDGVVEFIDTVDITADQLVKAVGSGKLRETKQAAACRELQTLLASGSVPQKEIIARMNELGISQRTCELAKATLPIETIRVNGHSEWRLA